MDDSEAMVNSKFEDDSKRRAIISQLAINEGMVLVDQVKQKLPAVISSETKERVVDFFLGEVSFQMPGMQDTKVVRGRDGKKIIQKKYLFDDSSGRLL